MTSIKSFAEILQTTEDVSAEEAQRFVDIISSESKRLTRLLDEILDLSFLESGRVEWRLEPVPLDIVINRALAATEGLRASAGVKVQLLGLDDDIVVQADFDRLAQVFINLVSNAVKYGRADEPEITIHAKRTGMLATISIADNGPGIAVKDYDRVFEKFSRLSEITLAGSAGLGLPISREIMRNLNGNLTVLDSTQGAVFGVTIPLA